jgi:tetratricopeptide (TPR) repeat protein
MMHARARVPLLAAELCLLPALSAAHAGTDAEVWRRVTSENFTFVGNAGEGELRRMAARLEQFRRAFAHLFPEVRAGSDTPTTVVVFRNAGSYAPFRPNGDAAGFFQPGENVNYIALTAERRDSEGAGATLFHEYVHLLVRTGLPRAPLWLSEGLAEVCATLDISDGGRRIRVGRALAQHARTLRTRALIPLPTLLAVRHDSPHYTVGEKRGLFYAQSWALTHYLLFGRGGERRDALWRYAETAGKGADAGRSFASAFGATPEELEQELATYAGRGHFAGRELRFDERLTPDAEARVEKMSAAGALAQLGDLLLHLNRHDDAETYLKRALALDARLSEARASLGMLRVRQGRVEEALAELEAAVALAASSPLAHYSYALGLSRARAGLDPTGRYLPETETRLREHLERAIELAPRYADAHELLALVELGAGNLERAEALLRRASTLAPARAGRHALTLAQVSAQRGDYAQARRLLDAVARDALDERVRARVVELLESVRRQEETDARRGRGGGEETEDETAAFEPPPVSAIRPKAEGQEQALGDLVVVECTADEVFLHLQVAGRTLRFHANNFERIPFVSYDPAMARGKGRRLSCGERTAANHVLLTYRPTTGARVQSDGEVVAVDFVPREWK